MSVCGSPPSLTPPPPSPEALEREGREQGFALALAALMLTAGGLALANRSSQGLLGSVYQLFGLQAREAAEIGVTRIVTELNKPQNRGLLRARGTTTTRNPILFDAIAPSSNRFRWVGR